MSFLITKHLTVTVRIYPYYLSKNFSFLLIKKMNFI